MSDQTPDPHDDVLRAALEAEADEVVAGPELLDRIRASAAAPPRRPLAPWLLVAAAAVAVAGLTAVLLRDDDQAVDISNDPASTSSSSTTDTIEPAPDLTGLLPVEFACEQGEVLDLTIYLRADASDGDVEAMRVALAADPRITSARHLDSDEVFDVLAAGGTFDPALGVRVPSAFLVDLAEGVDETEVRGDVADRAGVYGLYDAGCLADPARPERPTTIALVREDGWLVTVDLTTGAQRELHFGGDPNASSDVEEGGPSFIDGVDLSPDGAWVYFSTCCEPANGITYRVPTGGGEVEPVAMGRSPRVSPDGSVVATSAGTAIVVSPTQGASGTPVTVETGGFARQLGLVAGGHPAGGDQRVRRRG